MARVVLWALPGDWEQVELFAPDADTRIADRVRSNAAGAGLEPALVDAMVEAQLRVARRARDAGVVLWAAYGEGAGTPEDPLSLLSLTLAVGELPPPGGSRAPGGPRGTDPGDTDSSFASSVRPLVVDDPGLTAFLRERRCDLHVGADGQPLRQFQAQATLVSAAEGMVLVLTVTTPDPSREDQARAVAREVAATVKIVAVEAQSA